MEQEAEVKALLDTVLRLSDWLITLQSRVSRLETLARTRFGISDSDWERLLREEMELKLNDPTGLRPLRPIPPLNDPES